MSETGIINIRNNKRKQTWIYTWRIVIISKFQVQENKKIIIRRTTWVENLTALNRFECMKLLGTVWRWHATLPNIYDLVGTLISPALVFHWMRNDKLWNFTPSNEPQIIATFFACNYCRVKLTVAFFSLTLMNDKKTHFSLATIFIEIARHPDINWR